MDAQLRSEQRAAVGGDADAQVRLYRARCRSELEASTTERVPCFQAASHRTAERVRRGCPVCKGTGHCERTLVLPGFRDGPLARAAYLGDDVARLAGVRCKDAHQLGCDCLDRTGLMVDTWEFPAWVRGLRAIGASSEQVPCRAHKPPPEHPESCKHCPGDGVIVRSAPDPVWLVRCVCAAARSVVALEDKAHEALCGDCQDPNVACEGELPCERRTLCAAEAWAADPSEKNLEAWDRAYSDQDTGWVPDYRGVDRGIVNTATIEFAAYPRSFDRVKQSMRDLVVPWLMR